MRPLTIVFAFAALGAGFILLDRATAPPGGAGHTPSAADALNVAEALANRAGLAIAGIVLTAPTEDGRDFRGLHSDEGRLRPVYGRVRTICTGQAVGPSCWEISYLEIDGRPVAHKVTALETRVEPPGDDSDETIETADTGKAATAALTGTAVPAPSPLVTGRGTVEPPAGGMPEPGHTAEAPAPALPEPAQAAEVPEPEFPGPERTATGEVPVPAVRPELAMEDRREPAPGAADGDGAAPVHKPTHAVDRPVINVRGGPGTDMPVLARLPMGMRLSLIERQRDWGRFMVLDGAASGREVWAALQIVKPLP